MLPTKMAFLLLLVCAIISLDPTAAGEPCTNEQRDNILKHCEEYIKKSGPLILPSYLGACCVAVREVHNRDMHCIVRLLSNKQKKEHDERRILRLHELCELENEPPPPHHQVMT
ncbi:hypothetical protein BS78_05G113000 [Paspalum vaginatum]|nr:hypothetical protein BS78_05G113000 [Paspalum vaginatum]